MTDKLDALLDSALSHVVFDGWSDATFNAAAADIGLSAAEAKAICPRGAAGLAAAYHKRGDAAMLAHVGQEDLAAMRYSERVAALVWARVQVSDKETVRRGMALFSLPQHAIEGSRLVWGTADAIWDALGDSSRDGNWYSKRAILSGVIGSTMLYWLGDTSEGDAATRAFIDRRIADVMGFESLKGRARANSALAPLMRGFDGLMGRLRAPRTDFNDLPGHIGGRTR